MRALTIAATLVLSSACSGPEPATDPGLAPGGAGTAAPADAADAPAPDGDRPPAFGRVDPPGFILADDEGVELSGVTAYLDELPPVGTLRIELSSITEGGESTLLVVQDLEELGAWSMRVPQDIGPVNLLAYFDVEMNGPSVGEPSAALTEPIVVAQQDIGGIELVISALEPTPPDELENDVVLPEGATPDGDQVFVTIEDLGNPDAPQPANPPEEGAPPEQPAPAEEAPAE